MRDLPEFARFYMICRRPTHAGSQTKPERRYANLADAARDARALATQAGAPFIILEAVSVVEPDTAQGGLGL
jgi:hypothetical protein